MEEYSAAKEEPPSKCPRISPRGLKVLLPHGGLPENISPYLIKLIDQTGGKDGPIGRQFVAQPKKESSGYQKGKLTDPLNEDHFEVVPGLIYKYKGRVLWTITRFCATYCRFCTRGREIGIPAGYQGNSSAAIAKKVFLSDKEINDVFAYLKKKKEIREIILSGGDPLVTPRKYLTKIIRGLAKLQEEQVIDVIRIGTRLPIHNPLLVQDWHYDLLAEIKNPYVLVHINHPLELTSEAISVINSFRRRSLALVLSQTVLLKGVNNSVGVLTELFSKLTKEGIRPYYLYQNDPVYWAQHFTMPIRKAIDLWQKLRPRLSGLAATARFVIDTPYGFGKIPVPEGNAWKVDYSCFYDFKKKKQRL